MERSPTVDPSPDLETGIDCSSRVGPVGTPTAQRCQRQLRTVEWAYSVVTGAPNQGHILPSLTLAGLFDAKLPDLVAPDAGG